MRWALRVVGVGDEWLDKRLRVGKPVYFVEEEPSTKCSTLLKTVAKRFTTQREAEMEAVRLKLTRWEWSGTSFQAVQLGGRRCPATG